MNSSVNLRQNHQSQILVLKRGRFEPECLGKLNFYIEALDRGFRKAHEQQATGVLLCASKNGEVVEFALSRSLSQPS